MIRNAEAKDIPQIMQLLSQVLEIHAAIRPDLFISGTTKYTHDELLTLLNDPKYCIYVAVDTEDQVMGYAFCILQQTSSPNLNPRTTLYIDDLCVDSQFRGKHIGQQLFAHVQTEARRLGCDELTLNVWKGNDSARRFYERLGFQVRKTMMEWPLDDAKENV